MAVRARRAPGKTGARRACVSRPKKKHHNDTITESPSVNAGKCKRERRMTYANQGEAEGRGSDVTGITTTHISSVQFTPRHLMRQGQMKRVYRMGDIEENSHLIHILAKHETHMNARSTVLGLDPAKLRTRVIRTRSIFVLLKADDIVNPPIKSMIVGENITENTNLQVNEKRTRKRVGMFSS